MAVCCVCVLCDSHRFFSDLSLSFTPTALRSFRGLHTRLRRRGVAVRERSLLGGFRTLLCLCGELLGLLRLLLCEFHLALLRGLLGGGGVLLSFERRLGGLLGLLLCLLRTGGHGLLPLAPVLHGFGRS